MIIFEIHISSKKHFAVFHRFILEWRKKIGLAERKGEEFISFSKFSDTQFKIDFGNLANSSASLDCHKLFCNFYIIAHNILVDKLEKFQRIHPYDLSNLFWNDFTNEEKMSCGFFAKQLLLEVLLDPR